MLRYHDGCSGAPPLEATAAYLPSCSTRITGFLRSLPDAEPIEVMTITGTPRSTVPLVPPELSISSTCLRTHSAELGAYSPSSGMCFSLVDSGHDFSCFRRHSTR